LKNLPRLPVAVFPNKPPVVVVELNRPPVVCGLLPNKPVPVLVVVAPNIEPKTHQLLLLHTVLPVDSSYIQKLVIIVFVQQLLKLDHNYFGAKQT
jgi:hypothetical protein